MIESVQSPEAFSEFLRNRSRLIVLDSAAGDTLGMPIEGWTPELITKYLGEVTKPMSGPEVQNITISNPDFLDSDFPQNKFLNRQLDAGEWTDDTMLLMAVAEGIIEAGGLNLDAVAKAHINLYERIRNINPEGGWGAFGKTTLTAMENLAYGVSPRLSGVSAPGATGNGPALKTAPIGLYAYKKGLYEEGLEFAREVGQMTHLNPASVASGIVQAHAVYSLLDGVSREQFLTECVDVVRKFEERTKEGAEHLTPKLEFILEHPDMTPHEAEKVIRNRFKVTESYPFALFMFNKFWNNPTEGMIAAVNMGGDADSVGAIYGALIGARGIEFPDDWITVLKDKEKLLETSQALVRS